ncbi:tRNA (guanosine(46)-N7)-methyltransferase TrmB [bacterium]|jgi:tRNA (guanine-N7-)-methyltransferase|nr:tRNA (guanosine(46)-N7)-methyltransferase TrmB [bacterium]MBT4649469.1 tRNA (guanosine(46)-N7)-methyltransferase TrmB [bacterium]
MARKKLIKFADLDELSNVGQVSLNNVQEKLDAFIDPEKCLILELGCGKGEYSLALAAEFPQSQFIGIDIQGERLWHGATEALENNLNNVLFLRFQIEHIADYLPEHSVSEIWLSFPDPQLKKKNIKKRLTSPRFLNLYKKILKPNGLVHLKTDDQILFDYSLETITEQAGTIIESHSGIKQAMKDNPTLNIQTTYEKKEIAGTIIYYIKFQL